MKRFAAFEDSALQARLNRLRRSVVDLEERVRNRIAQAQAEGRWVSHDPLYQRLASILKKVRSDLEETEQEHLRRKAAAAARDAAVAKAAEKRAPGVAAGRSRRALGRGSSEDRRQAVS